MNNSNRMILAVFLVLVQELLLTPSAVSSFAFDTTRVRGGTPRVLNTRKVDLDKLERAFNQQYEEGVVLEQKSKDDDTNVDSRQSTTEKKQQRAGAAVGGRPRKSSDDIDLESLPPVLRDMVCERREYQMNLGKAMDVLRQDMQTILVKKPDFTIYHPELVVSDPSGVQLRGLDKYKSAFAFLQTFLGFWFSTRGTNQVQFRMVYDETRSAIRISWNVVLVPKLAIASALTRPLYIDAISYYQLDRASGKIMEHKIEKLVMNNMKMEPPYGIWSLLQQDALRLVPGGGVAVPGAAASTTTTAATASQ